MPVISINSNSTVVVMCLIDNKCTTPTNIYIAPTFVSLPAIFWKTEDINFFGLALICIILQFLTISPNMHNISEGCVHIPYLRVLAPIASKNQKCSTKIGRKKEKNYTNRPR